MSNARCIEIQTSSARQTTALGKTVASLLKSGDIVCLMGDLGSGKTTLVKGLAQKLGVGSTSVTSPTFVLLNIYEGKFPIYHFDLYRLEDVREIMALGYEEYVYGEGISVIEWAERLGNLIPTEFLRVELLHQGEDQRLIRISAHGVKYQRIMERLKK